MVVDRQTDKVSYRAKKVIFFYWSGPLPLLVAWPLRKELFFGFPTKYIIQC